MRFADSSLSRPKRIASAAAAIALSAFMFLSGGASVDSFAAAGGVSGISISGMEVLSQEGVSGETAWTYTDSSADLDFGTLTQPGAYISVAVTVENDNDFDVVITDKTWTADLEDPFYIIVGRNEVSDTIEANSSAVFIVSAGWDSDCDDPDLSYDDYAFGFTLVLTYGEDGVSLEADTSDSTDDSSGSSSSSSSSSSGSGSSSGSSATTVSGSQTGDTARPYLWTILIAGSIGLLHIAGKYSRKKKN